MSVTMRDAGPDSGLTSQNLARAILAGLEMRRFAAPKVRVQADPPPQEETRPLPPLPEAALPSVRPLLDPYANALGHKATARPGLFGRLICQTRRGFKALLRPWLEIQTRFNHATIDSLECSHSAIQGYFNQLTARLHAHSQMLAALNRSLDECNQTLQDRHSALEARMEDCYECLHTSRQMLEARIDKYHEELSAEGHGSAILEHFFIQTRLPAPPARILDISQAGHRQWGEISSLGYQVERHNFLQGRHSCALPFEDQCFDAVLCLSAFANFPEEAAAVERQFISEAARVLCGRGRLLLTVRRLPPAIENHWAGAGLEQHLKPFQMIEQVFGVQKHGTWSFTTDGTSAARERGNALAFVLAEKP